MSPGGLNSVGWADEGEEATSEGDEAEDSDGGDVVDEVADDWVPVLTGELGGGEA
jgi:hypothetical protein